MRERRERERERERGEIDKDNIGVSFIYLLQVKITTITNQNWDLPNHHGNIVASNNKYVAYVLEGRSGYVIRLIQNDSNNRVLLKNFVGAILDVSFAHANSNLLACVDQGGSVYIWDLDRTKNFADLQKYPFQIEILV